MFRGEYRTRYLYHAQMEPLSATAAVSPDGKSAEIWAGTQGPTKALNQVARLLQTERSKITLHQHVLGGGFGRRSQQEVIIEAVRLAKAVGKPVKLIWSREDDLTFGKFRPMTAHHIEAGLRCRLASSLPGITASCRNRCWPTPPAIRKPRVDRIVMKGSPIPQYPIPNKLAEHVIVARQRAARGLARRRQRPQRVRRRVLPRRDRQGAVEGSGRVPARAGGRAAAHAAPAADRRRDVGLAAQARRPWPRRRHHGEGRHLAAGVAEVSVDRASGRIKVHNVWCALDAGIAVQPKNLAAQTEGSIVYGLGHVLREQVIIKDGQVQQSNFTDYEIARMSDVPNIEIRVVSTDNPPTGGGEDGLPVLACAVGNAIATLTGVRLRELPFSPERVRGALGV